jgi:hypothetical protein
MAAVAVAGVGGGEVKAEGGTAVEGVGIGDCATMQVRFYPW